MVYTKRFFVEVTSLDRIPSADYIEKFNELFIGANVTVFEGVKIG